MQCGITVFLFLIVFNFSFNSLKSQTEFNEIRCINSIEAEDSIYNSQILGGPTQIIFKNNLNFEVNIFWVHTNGKLIYYGTIKPDEEFPQQTYVGHVWVVTPKHDKQNFINAFKATDKQEIACITKYTKKPEFVMESIKVLADHDKREIDVHWYDNNTKFWYVKNESEFICVNALTGKKKPFFTKELLDKLAKEKF